MTKLEEKLIELGYEIDREENDTENDFCACKKGNNNADIIIGVWDNKIKSYYLYTYFTKHIRRQDTIDNLQQAFNEMQKDLEELKECEE